MQNEKFTNEQITQYISDWQTSGLSKSKFCKLHGLTYHVFLYWITKATPVASPSFVPVVVSRHEEITIASPTVYKLHFPLTIPLSIF